LQLGAGDAAEFGAEALDELLAFLEVVDIAAAVELVAVAAVFRRQRNQTAGQGAAHAAGHQAAAAGKTMHGLDRRIVDAADHFLHSRQHALRATAVIELVLQRLRIGLLGQGVFFLGVHQHSSKIMEC